MRHEATERTAEVEERLRVLVSVLRSRPGGLHQLRLEAERAFGEGEGDLEEFVVGVEEALGSVDYPQGLGGARRVAFAPESRELVVEVELPGQAVVPSVTQYRFKASAPRRWFRSRGRKASAGLCTGIWWRGSRCGRSMRLSL